MILDYPDFSDLNLQFRQELHPLFAALKQGISEFSFANIYLFRETHGYKAARIDNDNGHFIISGRDKEKTFFLLPFGLQDGKIMDELFARFSYMKCVSENQASQLVRMGYFVAEDRDNFDYLYLRDDLAALRGPKFHKKRTLVNAFSGNYPHEARPLLNEYVPDALAVLDEWLKEREQPGDYAAAKEALENMDALQLCGGIYYVEGKPAAYTLGEELSGAPPELGAGPVFVIHFEKALGRYKGIYQFVNKSFASVLPVKYKLINREQDLGDEGLRQAKLSYRPVGFVKKFMASSRPLL